MTPWGEDHDVVAVCGDFHGSTSWARRMIRAIHRAEPSVRLILQVGDFWPSRELLNTIDEECTEAGITALAWLHGNHEPFPTITPLLDGSKGVPVRMSDRVHLLPQPFRLCLRNRSILTVGGAASVDRLWRTPGRDWWPEEAITDAHVDAAVAGGMADILLCHESPLNTPVREVQRILTENPAGYPDQTLRESEASRTGIERIITGTHPRLVIHGHMHAGGEGVRDDGVHVISLGCNEQRFNAALLHIADLSIQEVDVPGVH